MRKSKAIVTNNAAELKETYEELEKALKLLDREKPETINGKTLDSLRTVLLAKRRIIEAQIKVVRVLHLMPELK